MHANSTALVTGSSRGIGREVARQLVERGFDVIVTARRRSDAERAAADIGARYSHPLDVAASKSIDDLAAFVRDSVKRLDVLVNNAAILLSEDKASPMFLPPTSNKRGAPTRSDLFWLRNDSFRFYARADTVAS